LFLEKGKKTKSKSFRFYVEDTEKVFFVLTGKNEEIYFAVNSQIIIFFRVGEKKRKKKYR
jgi:hypothetical protein